MTVRVRDYMVLEVEHIQRTAHIREAIARLSKSRHHGLPVTDDAGRLVAVASMRNLMEYLSEFFSRDILNLPPDPRTTYRTREGA